MATGGCGGFFASVLAIGVTGQQQHPMKLSAEDTVLGGGGGSFLLAGGGTNPGSSDPLPADSAVPVHSVTASTGARYAAFFFMRASKSSTHSNVI